MRNYCKAEGPNIGQMADPNGGNVRTCLVCDDHVLMRGALALVVGTRWPEAVILEAQDFTQAWGHAATAPDLCLMDLLMPGADPVAGVAKMLDLAPDARVIVVTGTHDDGLLLELLGRGVHGFLEKTATADVMLAAIDLVLAGGRYLPPRVAELALRQGGGRDPAGRAPTDRQRQVLTLIAQGHSNKAIARTLGVSPATIKTHVANALASVGAANRAEAAIRARDLKLI